MSGPAARVRSLGAEQAELEVSKEIADRAGLRPGDELQAFAPGGNLLLVTREGARRGYFAGSLEALSLAEIFGFLCSAIRSGSLVLQSPGGVRRKILLHEGQVTFAASSEISERLGPVLLRHGMVDPEKLKSCEPRVNAGNKLGKLLIDTGALTPAQLYKGVQLQVREIVLAAFLEVQGDFAFIESEGLAPDAVKLPDRTRDLVIEGMNRADQVAKLRLRLDPAASPARAEDAEPPQVPEILAVWEKIDGTRSVREVVRASRLGEWAALRALDDLVRLGLVQPLPVTPAAAPTATVRPGESPAKLYRMAIRRICEELRAAGAEGRLFSFFSTPEGREGIFKGVHLNEQGELDTEALLTNAQRLYSGPMARARAMEALEAFVAFALFDARNALPDADAAALGREVARMLRSR
jgi:hypothetical protein